MKKSILILALLCLSYSGMTQFNDTIFYKSGMEKIVEITEYTDALIKFKTVNSKDNTVNSQVNTFVVLRYVMYDEEGILQYDSRSTETASNQTMQGLNKYPTKVSVSKHQLSVNPFFLPLLSFSGKYNYRFGDKMQYSICSRATYLSPVISDVGFLGDVMIGAGFQYAPFYNNRFAFGLDFTPMVGIYTDGFDDVTLLLPLSVDFDFYFSKYIGVSADFGVGRVLGNGANFIVPRGHIGVLIQFRDKTTFETNYR